MSTPHDASGVGDNIRAEMGRRRVSMVELARRTGVARSTLATQINDGRMTVANLMAIASALDVQASDLLPA